jgi:hypothetical protein
MQPQQVKLPSGEILTYDHMVPKLEWWANGHTLQSDMKVLPLGPYDAILGYGWLKMHSPMICHWEDKTLQFVQDGRDVLAQRFGYHNTSIARDASNTVDQLGERQ